MKEPVLRFRVEPEEAGRLDLLLARRFPGAGRRRLAAFFRDGHVHLDGERARKGAYAAAGAEVALTAPPPEPENLRPVPEPAADLAILYEDERLVAVDKPAGVPSHPLRVGETGTAANALVARFPELLGVGGDEREAGLVHRLDAGTSGVLVAARDPDAWRRLREALSSGAVRKEYLALVEGEVEAGGSEAPLVHRGKRVAVAAPGDLSARSAATRWEVEERFRGYTLLRCAARTGRMHQVRAHLGAAGAPIVGDPRYGSGAAPPGPLAGHFLHAAAVEIPHPQSGSALRLEAPLPDERRRLLDVLRTSF